MSSLPAFASVAIVPAVGGVMAASISPMRPAPRSCAAPSIYMRCRRDLKKEKHLRNLEYARAHRKKAPSRFNRRAQQMEETNSDNEYLSSIYGTISFGNHGQENESK